VLLRTLIVIAAFVVALGLAEFVAGKLSGDRTLVLIGYTLALISILFPLSWAVGRFENREPRSLLRRSLAKFALTAVAISVAYATVQFAPNWLVEKLSRRSHHQLAPAHAVVPNLAPLPEYPSGGLTISK
jgi:hypothetical protein